MSDSPVSPHDPKVARSLILDELFDLLLYTALRDVTRGDVQKTLDELIQVETRHLAFWQKFFERRYPNLDLGRRLKLRTIILACRLFGDTAVHLSLEAIEVYGVRKYLTLWRSYQGQPLAAALESVLVDEFQHEDMLVTALTERKINAEKIRNIFLGLNDGLVEILGAVSGFFGAFGDAVTVLIAASTTAVAGSLSMGAGAYLALHSEQEIKSTERDKKRFLGEGAEGSAMEEQPLTSAVFVGMAYLIGALVPVLPVLLGARSAVTSAIAAGTVIILVSTLLAFLSGMEISRRILRNLVIIAAAVGITYGIGTLARSFWGIAV